MIARQSIFAGLLLGVLVMASPAWGQSRLEDQKQLKKAQESHKAGRSGEAYKVLTALLKRRPDDVDAQRLMGHVAARLARYDQARQALIFAFSRGRLTEDVVGRLIEIDRKHPGGASLSSLLRFMTVLSPKDKAWQLLLAGTLKAEGRSREALPLIDGLLKSEPQDPDLHVRRGNTLLDLDRKQEAALAFEMAWTLGLEKAELAKLLGRLWRQLGQADAALRWLEKAQVLSRGSAPKLILERAHVLLEDGDEAGAEALLKAMPELKEKPLQQRRLRLEGRLYQQRGQMEEALKRWQQSYDLGDRDPSLVSLLGAQAFNAKKYKKAWPLMLQALKDRPKDARLRRSLVFCALKCGKKDAAREQIVGYIERFGLDEAIRKLITKL